LTAHTHTAADVIRALALAPHPEGGHYRETFRDPCVIDGRAASTSIYFLLARGERSHWHRIDAVEIWHYYAGAALKLEVVDGTKEEIIRLGADIHADEVPQFTVPARAWQAAESSGDWTLVGCTVAPGFSFDGFELAPAGWSPSGKTR
jgi:predicted cupin superfamily sugar epimerase